MTPRASADCSRRLTLTVTMLALFGTGCVSVSPRPSSVATSSGAAEASPTATAEASASATDYVLQAAEGQPTVQVTLPDGWSWEHRYWVVAANRAWVSVWEVANVFGHPCQWSGTLLDPPVGPSVDDLATALADQPMRNATVEDVMVAGYAGKVVHMSVPADLSFASCTYGTFQMWSVDGTEDDTRYSQGPGQLDDVYILDVDGTRVVLDLSWFPDTSPDVVAELVGIVRSFQID